MGNSMQVADNLHASYIIVHYYALIAEKLNLVWVYPVEIGTCFYLRYDG